MQIEIVTAKDSGGSASEDILFELLDSDGNALSAAEFRQAFGEGVLSVSGGYTASHASSREKGSSRIRSRFRYPPERQDTATLSVSISTLRHRLGEQDEISMEGVAARRQVSLKETSYYGTLTGIDPETSRGDSVIEIEGKALARTTGAPVGRAPLNVVVSSNGFERQFEVFADDAGDSSSRTSPRPATPAYTPCRSSTRTRPNGTTHGTFEIERVKISPKIVKMDIPVNREQTVNISASISEGLAIENLRLACEAADQPGGSLSEGVHVACGPAVGHAEGEGRRPFLHGHGRRLGPGIRRHRPEAGRRPALGRALGLRDGKCEVLGRLPPAGGLPRPNGHGRRPGRIGLGNPLFEKHRVRKDGKRPIRLTDADGEPAPDWIMPSGEKSLGDIEIGETKQSGIVCSPTDSTPEGLRDITLRIASDNHPEALIGVRVAVVQSGTGSALVKVSNIYTGTVDPDTSLAIEGLSGASVVLQNEAVATEVYTAGTDAAGEAVFSDIPAGLYAFRVSADGHNPIRAR